MQRHFGGDYLAPRDLGNNEAMESKNPRPRRGRRGLSDWAAVAEFVRAEMARHPEHDLDRIADRLGPLLYDARSAAFNIHIPKETPKGVTLRRFLSALRFVERLEKELDDEHAPLARSLRSVPIAAVELISRWIEYDCDAALDAAEALAAGKYTVEKLRQLEKAARGTTSKVTFGRGYAHRLRERLKNWSGEHFGRDYEFWPEIDSHEPPVDLLFRRKDNPRTRAGVMIFGPHREAKLYAIRKSEFLTSVVGASVIFERVVAIVPGWSPEFSPVECWHWLATNQVDRQNIELFSLSHASLSDLRPVQVSRPA